MLLEVNFGYSRFKQGVYQSTAFQNDITNQILKIRGMATVPESGAPRSGASPDFRGWAKSITDPASGSLKFSNGTLP